MSRGGIIAIVVVVVVIVVAAAWLGLGFALGRASGPVVTEEREVAGFSKVEVSGEGTLVVTIGDVSGLRIEGHENVVEKIDTSVNDDTLHIGQRWNWFQFGPFRDAGEIIYYLTTPDLVGIELSGAIDVRGESLLEGEEFTIECSGSSVIDLDLEVGGLRVSTSGSSDVTVRGTADTTEYDTSGSTNIRARDLVSRTATVDCSGSSNIEVNVSEQLTVHASGSSNVSYLGDPALDTDISGSGEVQKLEE